MTRDIQVADDPGRQIRKVWLGATGARWPWDWTYDEWIIAFAAFTIGGTLITWLIPSAVVVGVLTWWLARKVARLVGPDAPQKTFRIFVGLVVLACGIISIHPSTWLHPLWLPIALVVSFALPRAAVKSWGGYVDWNRPIPYWFRLPRVVARGPRQVQEELLDPSGLALWGSDPSVADLEPGQRKIKAARKAAKRPIVSTAWGTPPRKVKATITDVAKGGKPPVAEHRLVPLDGAKAKRQKLIENTPYGLRVFGTYYRLEQR